MVGPRLNRLVINSIVLVCQHFTCIYPQNVYCAGNPFRVACATTRCPHYLRSFNAVVNNPQPDLILTRCASDVGNVTVIGIRGRFTLESSWTILILPSLKALFIKLVLYCVYLTLNMQRFFFTFRNFKTVVTKPTLLMINFKRMEACYYFF